MMSIDISDRRNLIMDLLLTLPLLPERSKAKTERLLWCLSGIA